MTSKLFEYTKSVTVAPLASFYKSKTKRNRSVQFFDHNKETKSVYVHIPKTGGHSVAVALYDHDPWHFRLKDYQALAGRNGVDFNSFFVFSVVRDPIERLSSMYRYLKGLRYTHRDLVDLKTAASFAEFVEIFAAQKAGPEAHPFTWSQLDYLRDSTGNIGVEFVAKLENLQEDFTVIAERLGQPDAKLLHLNKSKSTSKISDQDRIHAQRYLQDEMDALEYT